MLKLHVIEGPRQGENFQFAGEVVFVGRSAKNDIQILDDSISRKHLKIFRIEKSFFVEDLKSTNGTFVNGNSVEPGEGQQISDGDIISLGTSLIRVSESLSKHTKDLKGLVRLPLDEAVHKDSPVTGERRSRSLAEMELISKVSQKVKESPDLKEVLGEVMEHLLERLPRVDRAGIFLFDNEKQEINEVLTRARFDSKEEFVRNAESIVKQSMQIGKALRIVGRTQAASADFSENDMTLEIRSVICIPMRSRIRTHGAIYLEGLCEQPAFRNEDLWLLESLSGLLALALENRELT
jgi:3',5'-cyclic-nucleotide phosphodiesterase